MRTGNGQGAVGTFAGQGGQQVTLAPDGAVDLGQLPDDARLVVLGAQHGVGRFQLVVGARLHQLDADVGAFFDQFQGVAHLIQTVEFDIGAGDGQGDAVGGGGLLDPGGLGQAQRALQRGVALAPEVDVIAGVDRQPRHVPVAVGQQVLRIERGAAEGDSAGRTHIDRRLGLGGRNIGGRRRRQHRAHLVEIALCLFEARPGGLDVRRMGQRLAHQGVELRIVEGGPPLRVGPLGAGITRKALVGLEVAERDWRVGRRRRHGGAPAQQQGKGQRRGGGFEGG